MQQLAGVPIQEAISPEILAKIDKHLKKLGFDTKSVEYDDPALKGLGTIRAFKGNVEVLIRELGKDSFSVYIESNGRKKLDRDRIPSKEVVKLVDDHTFRRGFFSGHS